ncbi:MFS general substrate transporter [Aspergillus sclerotioniger CBS 115572]|uniref:MFS general substrate transporter n=1 Tax=Aspergillus sclerotioniger CBS 115572 TaxID=1450535 RepID=A0A317WM69_9EURO|nr:MFS general substrate transporter [Aspergillus sclerotioniger CBS 115572]PWY87145.1 MFS general substrate transporter [Aspergillus sclerotioniger CBS 115572]
MSISVSDVQHAQAEFKDTAQDGSSGSRPLSTPDIEEAQTDELPPDGGVTAWLVVLGAWCAMFSCYGWLHSVGVFQDYYQTVLFPQYSASTISWIPSLEVFLMLGLGPIVGRLNDTLGPRVVVIAGSFLHIFGLIMTSISTEYYQVLLAQGICSSIGLSAIAQPALSIIPSWFNKRLGAAYGIMSSGAGISGVILPVMVSRLIDKASFGWAMRSVAFLLLFLLIIANLTIRARLPPCPEPLNRESLLRPLRDVKMVLLVSGSVLLTLGMWVPLDYIITSALAAGMRPNLGQWLVPMQNAGSIVGRTLSGVFADKIGTYNTMISFSVCTGILVLALWIPAISNAAIIVFDVLFGIASGAYFSLVVAMVACIAPPQEIGYWSGVNFMFASIAGLVTGPIAGAILVHGDGSYWGMKLYSGVLILVGSVLVLGTRVLQTGFVLQAKR